MGAPLASASLRELPLFPILDCCVVRSVAVTDQPFRSRRRPTARQGNTGGPAAALSPAVELRGYGFLLGRRWLSS